MDEVRLVDYFYVTVPDKPGVGAGVFSHVAMAGVSLISAHAFPQARRTQIDFVPADAAAFKAAAKAAKWKVTGPKKAFLIQGDDRTGALVDYYTRLAAAKINVTAMDAIATGAGRFGAVIWVKPADVKRAAKALGIG